MNARPPKTAMKQIEADKQSICVMQCLSLKSISFVHRPSRRSLYRDPGSLVQMDRGTFQSVRGLMTYADRSLLSFRTMILYNRSYIATTVKKAILSLNWDKNKKHPKRGTFIFHRTDINFKEFFNNLMCLILQGLSMVRCSPPGIFYDSHKLFCDSSRLYYDNHRLFISHTVGQLRIVYLRKICLSEICDQATDGVIPGVCAIYIYDF